MAYVETLLQSWLTVLQSIGATLSLIMIIGAGLIYAVSHVQPGETRGKWQQIAIGVFIGGVAIAAILGAAELIKNISSNLLT